MGLAIPDWNRIAVGDALTPMVRKTDLAHWNRYAAVNDEFVQLHMDPDAARAVGQPDVFGMGNLRLGYLHALLDDWLGDAGDIAELSVQFRGFNFKHDELSARAAVTGKEEAGGVRLLKLELGVDNQKGENTTPGQATLVLFQGGKPAMPDAPPAPAPARPTPGKYLDAPTIAWIGRETEPNESLPVGANEIRRWAMAIHYPERAPERYYSEAVAARGVFGGLVAPRDFNPFAWMQAQDPPNRMPWMRGIGTTPGNRILNGGQSSRYFQRIRPGDVITSRMALEDAYEREGRLGTMLFLITRMRWINQRGELVRLGRMITIYY
jgi:acyl dehydratase